MKAKKDTTCLPLPEPFVQIIMAVMARMVFKDRKHVIAQLLVEARCLKTERAEDHMVTPTGAGFLFRCLQELRAIALSSQGFVDPEVLDVATAAPGPAMDSCQPFPREAFHPQGQIGAIVIARLFDAVGV